MHTFPLTQEILSGLHPTSRVFAKLDATQGYHQVLLEEESSGLTTFLLPSGRFRFLRAPMGLSCSSDEFCHRSDQVIEGLPGIRKLVDDIRVQAPDIQTLNNRIQLLIDILLVPIDIDIPILLAFDETRRQDHDRQMRSLPAAEAKQSRRTSHHDVGQLPYGATLRRSVSRQGQNVHGRRGQVQRIYMGRYAARSRNKSSH